MKKFIGILLALYLLTFLFGADQVDFPDIYIDESVAPGGVGSEADPYSDFDEINWGGGGDNSIADWYAGAEDASVTINLQRGETWRELDIIGASGSATYPIIIRPYGAGADPIITATDLIETWGVHAGDVWKATCVIEPNHVFFDGTKGTPDGTPESEYDWYWDTNELFCFAATDPDARYTAPGVEAGARDYCFHLSTASYITFQELRTWGSNAPADGGNIRTWDNGGSDRDGIVIHDCEVDNSFTSGIRIHIANAAGELDGMDIYNNVVHDNGDGVDGYGMYFLGVNVGNFLNVNIYDNETYNNIQEGIRLQGVTTAAIYSNYSHYDGHAGAQSACILVGSNSSGVDVYYNKLEDPGAEGVWVGTTAISGLDIYYNLIFGGGHFGIHLDNGIDDVEIYNNAIYDCDGGLAIGIGGQVTNAIFKNNIVDANNGVSLNVEIDSASTLTSNYNCFDENKGFDNEDVIRTFAQWQGDGYDTINSLNEDPVFVNSGADDFHLQVGSPCRNVGDDVSLTPDYDGVTVPQETNPAMGAYEYLIGAVLRIRDVLRIRNILRIKEE